MSLTLAGVVFSTILAVLIFIISILVLAKITKIRKIEATILESFAVIMFITLFSVIISGVAVMYLMTAMHVLADRTEKSRTIYSNDIKSTVMFETGRYHDKFIGGQPIKNTTDVNLGTLIVSKDGVDVKKKIDHVEYLGDVEKGSIVKKIEYSEVLKKFILFGHDMMIEKTHSLKIHLKKPASQIHKEKKDAETQKELNGLLEFSK